MAKEPTPSRKTPEEIAAMEDEVRQYRAEEAAQRALATREAGRPIKDLVDSDGFKAMVNALPALSALAQDRELFPYLEPHIVALRNGAYGLQQTSDGLFAGEVATEAAPPA